MGYAPAFKQSRTKFVKYAATITAILLIAPACYSQATSVVDPQSEMPWAQGLKKYPGLLPELGRLVEKLMGDIQFPPARSESHLLPLLPPSTMSYAALPNYGDAANQTLKIFRQELAESAVLRDWWARGSLAVAGPKIEDGLEKFSQLYQYLGEEIVVSGAMESRDPHFLFVAEVRKPGLKKFLELQVEQLVGKSNPGVRVMDVKELAAAKDEGHKDDLLMLVRPDFLVGTEGLATLRSFNARLDRGSRDFVSTLFGQRVVQAYDGGVTTLAAADLHEILNQVSPGTIQSAPFQRSGFADMKYLVWERKTVAGQAMSQAELSFNALRHGSASWLAKPVPLGSLDFVSPKAMLAGTVVFTNLTQMFEDIKDLADPSNSNSFAALAQAEQALKLNLKNDLLGQLGGEITLELDSVTPPMPAWKAMLKVNDDARLQQTLSKLLAAAHFEADPVEARGVTYYTVRIPSQNSATEIGYAFADGYLIVASSREGVAEAVRLHGSGGSLAKSKKFLASLPPGHPPEASALLYEDPVAVAALQLRRFAPELADSVAQSTGDATPSVVCLYGEETAIREASKSGGADIGAALVVAAIAIPNLLRSRIAANEASAVGSVRTVNTAQVTYAATYPHRGFAPNLATLGTGPHATDAESPDHAGLIDNTLANESCTGNEWCAKSGFHFRLTAVCKQHKCSEYVVVAMPVDSSTGTRSFCSTSDGVIRFKPDSSLNSPLTASQCKAWPPL